MKKLGIILFFVLLFVPSVYGFNLSITERTLCQIGEKVCTQDGSGVIEYLSEDCSQMSLTQCNEGGCTSANDTAQCVNGIQSVNRTSNDLIYIVIITILVLIIIGLILYKKK